jgi:hypothetical protein
MLSKRWLFGVGLAIVALTHLTTVVQALPPPQDQPEEVIRTEVILEARSPVDGKLISAAEYAELQAQYEQQNREIGVVPPKFRQLISLLRLLKVLRTIFPFL